jgi:hypothetical protein
MGPGTEPGLARRRLAKRERAEQTDVAVGWLRMHAGAPSGWVEELGRREAAGMLDAFLAEAEAAAEPGPGPEPEPAPEVEAEVEAKLVLGGTLAARLEVQTEAEPAGPPTGPPARRLQMRGRQMSVTSNSPDCVAAGLFDQQVRPPPLPPDASSLNFLTAPARTHFLPPP